MIDRFPGPKSYPVVGNFLEWNYNPRMDQIMYLIIFLHYTNCILDEMFLLVRKYANEFKMTYRVWVAYIGGVCIITPEDAEVSCVKSVQKLIIYFSRLTDSSIKFDRD